MPAVPGDAGAAPARRLAALDVLRGIAVLGIVAVNIAGLAGPRIATETPAVPGPASPLDMAAFAFVFVVFEGKMRALFSLLFGASMLLFITRAERAGRDGDWLQLRRLGWLGLFGYAHYILFWWGDILFVYAVGGFLALLVRRMASGPLLALAGVIFCAWHGMGMMGGWTGIIAEEHVRRGVATMAEAEAHAATMAATLARMHEDFAAAGMGFADQVLDKLATAPGWPVTMTLYTLGETVPLMLLGMVLMRTGLFAGEWPRRRLRTMAAGGLGLGGGLTVLLLAWAWPRAFPAFAMSQILGYWAALPHLLMTLGYIAAAMLAMERLVGSGLGGRLGAAGRMAFSNYLLTTVAMCAVFQSWGLGLYGRLTPTEELVAVAAWWLVMLAWSPLWLAHFRQGPLEWAWRSLTEGRPLAFRRAA